MSLSCFFVKFAKYLDLLTSLRELLKMAILLTKKTHKKKKVIFLFLFTRSPVKPGLRVRVFCDICDVFDLHDTEDCPKQSNETGGSQHHGVRGEERVYCTACESKSSYRYSLLILILVPTRAFQ